MSTHRHPANIARHDDPSLRERLPDLITARIGTMAFIYWSTAVIAVWIALNGLGLFVWRWDPYPFVFLNLAFSAFAFYSAPLILMSQNRQTEHDRVSAEHDYATDAQALALLRRVAVAVGVPDGAGEGAPEARGGDPGEGQVAGPSREA